MPKKLRFGGPFHKQHHKRAQALRNLHHSTFIILIDHCQVNWVGKNLPYWRAKSWDCLLTHWLPMKRILFLLETIERYQFRCNYLRNQILFLNFFEFLKSRSNFKYFETKYGTHRFFICKITDPENVVR